jgi:hypothetical protein
LLKTVLLLLITVTSLIRLVDMVYLLVAAGTNLPFAVIILACILLGYALILIAKRLIGGNVTLRQFMAYFIVHAIVTVFNLVFTSLSTPLRVTGPETLAIGTFFDVLVDILAVYLCQRQIRSHYLAVVEYDKNS